MSPRARTHASAGFTLVEMMVATVVMILTMAGVGGLYLAHHEARISEDLSQTVEAELRLAMEPILFKLRNAGYGAPWGVSGDPTLWITWVPGLTTSPPVITAGATAADPDALTVANCTSGPVARLAANAAANDTSLILDSAAELDASSRSVILINDSESAKIVSVSGDTIDIDRDPDETASPGQQGVSRAYPIGTPLCRVDVVTYSVDTATATLRENLNQGAGPEVIVDGITNLKVTSDTTGVKPTYTVTLTARASDSDPFTAAVAQRSLTSIATPRN